MKKTMRARTARRRQAIQYQRLEQKVRVAAREKGLFVNDIVELNESNFDAVAFQMGVPEADTVVVSSEDTDESFKFNAELGWAWYNKNERVSDAIDYHVALALGEDTEITCEKDKYQKLAAEFALAHKVHRFVYENIIQLLTKGECACKRHWDGTDLKRLQTINPVSLDVEYTDGIISKCKQGSTDLLLDRDNLIHLKWKTPSYANRGLTMVFPAFNPLNILESLEKSDAVVQKKYKEPLQQAKIGGLRGKKYHQASPRSLQLLLEKIKRLRPGEVLATSDLVELITHFPDEKIPDNIKKHERQDTRISIAMKMSRPLATGDGPNYATADAAVKKQRVLVGIIREYAQQLWRFAMEPFVLKNGVKEKLTYGRVDTDPSIDIDVIKVFLEAFKQQIVSRESVLRAMKLVPEVEAVRMEKEGPVFNAAQIKLLVDAGVITKDQARSLLNLGKSEDRETEDNQSEFSANEIEDVVMLYAKNGVPIQASSNKSCCKNHNHQPIQLSEGDIKNLESLVSVYEPTQKDYEEAIKRASGRVQDELKRLSEREEKTKGQLDRIDILDGLKEEITKIENELNGDFEKLAQSSVDESLKAGIDHASDDLNSYDGFKIGTKNKKAIFASIDKKALKYLQKTQLELMGTVSSELMANIHTEIVSGVISGESLDKVARNIGKYIDDPEEFANAGKTVFKTAQTRVRVIVRTETMRAYNQGCIHTYKELGVKQVKWIVTDGCDICNQYKNKIFNIDDLPDLPVHPNCKCTIVAVITLEGE